MKNSNQLNEIKNKNNNKNKSNNSNNNNNNKNDNNNNNNEILSKEIMTMKLSNNKESIQRKVELLNAGKSRNVKNKKRFIQNDHELFKSSRLIKLLNFNKLLSSSPSKSKSSSLSSSSPKLSKEKNNELKLPRFIFAGRSNVGKSSLINALVTKKGTGGKAAVSEKPGETQDIYLYQLGKTIEFIDSPGYGFSFASEEKRENWKKEIKNTILHLNRLKRVFILIDIRQGLKVTDYEFLTFLNQNKISNQIILTKTDLLYRDKIVKQYEYIQSELRKRPFNYTLTEDLILFSSKKLTGVSYLQKILLTFSTIKNKKK
jgi:GTP-binding protein